MKKIISLLIAAILVLSVASVGLGQEEYDYNGEFCKLMKGCSNDDCREYALENVQDLISMHATFDTGPCKNIWDSCLRNAAQEKEAKKDEYFGCLSECNEETDYSDSCYSTCNEKTYGEGGEAGLDKNQFDNCVRLKDECAKEFKPPECPEGDEEPIKQEESEEVDCEEIEDDLTGGLSNMYDPEDMVQFKDDFQEFARALLNIINGAKDSSSTRETDRRLDELFSSYYPESASFLDALRNIQDSGVDVPGDLNWDYLAERSNNIADTVSIFDIAMNKWKAGELGNIENEYVLQKFLANTANGFKNPEGPYSLDYIMQNALQEAKREGPLKYAQGNPTNIAAIATVERYKQENEFTYFMEDKDPVYEAMDNPEFVKNLKRMHDVSQGLVEAKDEQEELAAIFSTMIPGVDTADITASATYSFQEGNYLGAAGYTAIGTMGLWLGPIAKPFKEIFEGTAKGAAKAGLKARLLSKLTKAGIIRQVEKEAVQEAANAGKKSIYDWFNPELKEGDTAAKASKCFDPVEDAIERKLAAAKKAHPDIPEEFFTLNRKGDPIIDLDYPRRGNELKKGNCVFPQPCEVSPVEFRMIKQQASTEGVPIEDIAQRIKRSSDGSLSIKPKESPTLRPEEAKPEIISQRPSLSGTIQKNKEFVRDQIKNRVRIGRSYEDISQELFGVQLKNFDEMKPYISKAAEGGQIGGDFISPTGREYGTGFSIYGFLEELPPP